MEGTDTQRKVRWNKSKGEAVKVKAKDQGILGKACSQAKTGGERTPAGASPQIKFR